MEFLLAFSRDEDGDGEENDDDDEVSVEDAATARVNHTGFELHPFSGFRFST